jgi:hypothetical protein
VSAYAICSSPALVAWCSLAHSVHTRVHGRSHAHMAGWVLGHNTADPHMPTHPHTHCAYKAYCAPTHTHTQHEQRTCTAWATHMRPSRTARTTHAPRRITCDSQSNKCVRWLRSELTSCLLAAEQAEAKRRAPLGTALQYHIPTTASGANEGGCVKPRKQLSEVPLHQTRRVTSFRCLISLFSTIESIDCHSQHAVYSVSIFVPALRP